MERITDYRCLSTRVEDLQRPGLVGIEGFTGSGKSYLADKLAQDSKLLAIHTDDYVHGEDESLPYRDRIDHTRLAAAVIASQKARPLTIVEGICLREILRRSKLEAICYVYVKKLAENGLWHDGLHLEDFEGAGEITEDKREPHKSDFAYHSVERPHEKADVIFERIEAEA